LNLLTKQTLNGMVAIPGERIPRRIGGPVTPVRRCRTN